MIDKSEWPNWDYWMRQTLSDGRPLSIYYEQTLEDGDIRSEKYEADAKWCREYFWDAEQASLLSFSRDPAKCKANENWLDEDHYDYKEHARLWNYMSKLHELILDAQKKGQLSPDFFWPARYVAWAKRVGVSVPQWIVTGVERAERERQVPKEKATELSNDPEPDSDDDLEPKNSHEKKFKNGLAKVILALLLHSNLDRKPTDDLADKLATALVTRKNKQKDKELALGAPTIKKRLDEAHELLK